MLRWFLAVFVLMGLAAGLAAGPATAQPGARVPTEGPFRALVVFVRFQDDTSAEGCAPAWQQWPDPDALPAVAPHLLAADPSPPFADSSLTAYFYRQSQGRFVLYGDVFPRVVVTRHPEATYGIRDARSAQALGRLSREVLDAIDPEVDFRRYDANRDGYVDHVFVILRRNRQPISWSGYSILGTTGTFDRTYDGLRVDPDLSGSYSRYGWSGNIFPQRNLVRLMAHEFGHDLWTPARLGGAHIQPIRGRFGVPEGHSDRIGYALMVGAGGGTDIRGDLTISAWERDLLGWIACPPLTADTTVVLHDLYTTGACRTVALPVPAGQPPRTLYLANRQRIGFFDRLRVNECTAPPNAHGLKTTGLLVTVVEHREGGRGRMAVLPADGTLALSLEAAAYDGDLFGPGSAVQLTPWTRPAIGGYAAYPPGFSLGPGPWPALVHIRPAGDRGLAIDYVADYRRRPIIREDAWIGPETAGQVIPGSVQVVNGRTLDVDLSAGRTLTLAAPLRVADGRAVVGGPGQTLVLERGAEVGGAGTLVVRAGTTLRLGAGQLLIARHGGHVQLEPGAVLVYEGVARVRAR
ncbi:hypothetical protein AWN76_010025 [Rhodothermaceae bacterium RA]|nr:hypothetical protein AWN76_010025 [Rhodothermaceae bacterium RA]